MKTKAWIGLVFVVAALIIVPGLATETARIIGELLVFLVNNVDINLSNGHGA